MKNGEAQLLLRALAGDANNESVLKDLKLPAKVSFAVARSVEKLASNEKTVEEQRKKIIEGVCEKDADGKPVIEEKEGVSQYKITNPEEFAKQYNELMDAEADVELFKFEEELLYADDVRLTDNQSQVLLYLIK
jgi:hypothetical protein